MNADLVAPGRHSAFSSGWSARSGARSAPPTLGQPLHALDRLEGGAGVVVRALPGLDLRQARDGRAVAAHAPAPLAVLAVDEEAVDERPRPLGRLEERPRPASARRRSGSRPRPRPASTSASRRRGDRPRARSAKTPPCSGSKPSARVTRAIAHAPRPARERRAPRPRRPRAASTSSQLASMSWPYETARRERAPSRSSKKRTRWAEAGSTMRSRWSAHQRAAAGRAAPRRPTRAAELA